VRAVNAFLQASQYIFRYQRVAGERYLRQAIELDPTFIEPQVWLIPGLAIQGKMDEARAMYERLLARERTASPYEQMMIAYAGAMLNGDAEAQARQIEIGLEYMPGNNILLANLAEHREQSGNCAGALDALRPAVEMRWHYPPIYELWGWCAIDAGRYDETRRVLLDATNLPPVHPNVYALLEALALADGDAATADRFDAMYVAATRRLDRPAAQTYVVKAFRRLADVCASRGQPDRAARLNAKAAAAGGERR
jgi:tetratricopeptide (TPR) repeat protein